MNIKLAPTVDLDNLLMDRPVSEKVSSDTTFIPRPIGSATTEELLKDDSDTTKETTKNGSATTVSSSVTTTSKGQKVNQWRKENRDTLRVDLPKGLKAILQDEAETRNVSVTTMIRQALSQYLGRDV